jgi:hypothetical protein
MKLMFELPSYLFIEWCTSCEPLIVETLRNCFIGLSVRNKFLRKLSDFYEIFMKIHLAL